MATPGADSLEIPVPGSERLLPRFTAGAVLRASDLQDQQLTHAEARRRHLLACHGPGVIAGLRLRLEGDSVLLEPGLAVDDQGNEVVLRDPMNLDDELGRLGREAKRARIAVGWCGYVQAADPRRGTGENWVEAVQVRCTAVPTPSAAGAEDDGGSAAARVAAHAIGRVPVAGEPVVVATVERIGPAGGWRVVDQPAPGPELRVSGLRAADDTVRLRLGSASDDPWAMRIDVDPGTEKPTAASEQPPSFGMQRDGTCVAHETLHAAANVTAARLQFRPNPGGVAATGDGFALYREGGGLRLALPATNGAAFVVGAVDKDGRFQPVLTVTAGGVQILGNLIVTGEIRDRNGQLAPAKSEAAAPKPGKLEKLLAKLTAALQPLIQLLIATALAGLSWKVLQ